MINENYTGLEVAIIGMSGRFPGANSITQLWENLKEGRESITFFNNSFLREKGVPEKLILDDQFVKAAGHLDHISYFDTAFFNYSPQEASMLDPQIRVFHEVVYHALEDAGYVPVSKQYKTGIFAGIGENLRWKAHMLLNQSVADTEVFSNHILGNKDFFTTLIANKLNLTGPAITVNTACSTSLVAVHLACRSILTGESKLAIAGGVSFSSERGYGYRYEPGMILSPDGHCRAFDMDSGGCVYGEGAAAVVLKRLESAMKDGDHIYAVIKGSAINNDGTRKVGYAAPSVEGQAECIMMAQKIAKIDPSTITYLEAHGTGTAIGDPIEVAALNMAFGNNGKRYCAIGSIKTNIGHLNEAAGVTGLIKTVLSIQHRLIPASLHFKTPNKNIDFENGPFYVNNKLSRWEGQDVLRAGVSSFGIGGTNAHVILESPPLSLKTKENRPYNLLLVSGKTSAALDRNISNLEQHILTEPTVNLDDVAYTLQTSKCHFEWRKALVFEDRSTLMSLLKRDNLKSQKVRTNARKPSIVFMFPGQGSQYLHMSSDLYNSYPLFRKVMDQGFEILKILTNKDWSKILYGNDISDESLLTETYYTQPLLFLVEYSLNELITSYGIQPDYMIGHSLGEYVAACVSGVFTFEEALRLIVKRSILMQGLPFGTMISASMTEKEAELFLDDSVSLAAVNGPERIVFSGNIDSINRLGDLLDKRRISYLRLSTSHAFHSSMQNSIIEEFRHEVSKIIIKSFNIPFISNLTGDFITNSELQSDVYWGRQLRETVRFADGLKRLLSDNPNAVFVEVGPGNTLTSLLKQQNGAMIPICINLMRPQRESGKEGKYFIAKLGRLWELGLKVNFNVNYENQRNKVALPAYSFEQETYPAELGLYDSGLSKTVIGTYGRSLKDWVYYPVWKSSTGYNNIEETNIARRVYLFLSPGTKFADSFSEHLRKRGDNVIEILVGKSFEKKSVDRYYINLFRQDDFIAIFDELGERAASITDVLHGWCLGSETLTELELSENNKRVQTVFFSIKYLLRGLLKQGNLNKKRWILLTNCLHKVSGDEQVIWDQALALGLTNVLPQEYNVLCRNIDLNIGEEISKVTYQLLVELQREYRSEERVVALRFGKRWTLDYERNCQPIAEKIRGLKRHGCYLITGGLGNVGYVLAKYLLQEYEARLIIIGRQHKDVGTVRDRLENLSAISERVTYFSCDIADVTTFENILIRVEKEIGLINGVIHSAGITSRNYFEPIEDLTIEKAFALFEPKILGIHTLYSCLKNRRLDFVWITSSIAAILGGVSFGAYSAANLYMDQFVSAKSTELRNWIVVNLSAMVFNEKRPQKQVEWNRTALNSDEISRLFEWTLTNSNNLQFVQTIGDLHENILKTFHKERELHLDTFNYSPTGIQRKNRPELSTTYIGPSSEIEKRLVVMMGDLFGISDLGVEDDFFELGGDSLKAMVLLKKIEQAFGVRMELSQFFQTNNIKSIADHIAEQVWLNSKSERQFSSRI